MFARICASIINYQLSLFQYVKEHRQSFLTVQIYDIKNPDAIDKITSGKQSGKKERIREEKREKLLFSLPIKT